MNESITYYVNNVHWMQAFVIQTLMNKSNIFVIAKALLRSLIKHSSSERIRTNSHQMILCNLPSKTASLSTWYFKNIDDISYIQINDVFSSNTILRTRGI